MLQKTFIIVLFLIVHSFYGQTCLEVDATTTTGANSITVDCDFVVEGDICVDLEVSYTEVASTDEYDFTSIPFQPEIPFDQGTPLISSMPQIDGMVDDKFSDVIPLGFDFCFYDQNFSNIIIGTNGILTFDQEEANTDAPSGISVSNPNPALVDNAIFAVQHDLIFDVNSNSEIYYSTIGTAPCRKFVINYYEATHYGCTESSTIQIVLHEFTNEIEVHILDKPLQCDNGRDVNSLLGIMNADGSQGISPPDRNTGEWSTSNESWRFFPSGNIPPVIQWYDDLGNLAGEGQQITVCPDRNTTYTAQVQYQSCVGNTLFGTDEINVNYAAEFPAVENDIIFLCDEGNDGSEQVTFADYNDWISLNNVGNFIFTYYSSLDNATQQTNPITTTTITGNIVYYVRIANANNPNCFTITPISLTFSAAEIENLVISLCDNNANDGIEPNVNLVPHIEVILNGLDYIGYTIHLSEQDASNEINAITEANLTSDTNIWLNLQVSENCQQIVGPITIDFLPSPPARSADTIVFSACDVNFNHMEPFDWSAEIPQVIDLLPGETFSVHTSLANAENNTRAQTQISDNFNPYYVRIKNSNGCYTIVEVPVEVEFFGVDAVMWTENICFDGVEDITVNLNDYPLQMLIDPLEGVDISIYATNEDAEGHVVENIIDPIQTITEDGYNVVTNFYVRFQLSEDCYTVRQIRIRLVHPVPMVDSINVCDIYNDESEENNLNIYSPLILGDQVGTVSYFLNQSDANNNSNQITRYNFDQDITLYVRIESYGCVEIYPIDFFLLSVIPLNNLTINIGEVCDVDQNGITELDLTIFEFDIYNGDLDLEYNYFEDYDPLTQTLSNPIENPSLHPVTGSFTFYIQALEENNVCNSIAEIIVNIDFGRPFEVNDAELYTCDFQFDLNEEFTLAEALPQMTSNLPDFNLDTYSVTYYKNLADLENETNAIGPIFTPNSAVYPIYVNFQNNITGCTAVSILTLYTVDAPKPVRSSTAVCDNNLNGIYEIDLNILGGLVMEGNTEGFVFSYYLSEAEAETQLNPLDSSQYYEVDPFPPTLWVRVENELVEGCYDTQYVDITFNELTEIEEHTLYQFSCDIDNDGFSNFDLTFVEEFYPSSQYNLTYYESLEQINNYEDPIQNPTEYINTIADLQNIIVVISEGENCPIYATIELEVIPTPRVTIPLAQFCPGFTTDVVPELVDPNSNYTYEWMNSQGEIISTEFILTDIGIEGTYTLLVTDVEFPQCRMAFDVEVLEYVPPTILDIVVEGSTITVVATGLYPIEYSIDGINWQGLNYFTNLPPGPHTFWVRYITEGCVSLPKRGLILNMNNVITPNGDGYNDYITIKDLDVFEGEESKLEIYDRYGKLIFMDKSNTSISWDGKYLGRVLNSTDYWYILTLPDGRELKGSITVKNF